MFKNLLKRIDKIIFPDFYNGNDEYKNLLKKYVSDCDSLLDVGCGHVSPVSTFIGHMSKSVGVDGYDKAIETAKKYQTHRENFVMDVKKIGEVFPEKSFDCIVALDLIEHLTKEEGEEILKAFEKIAKKRIIVFTPNGFIPQKGYDNNVLQIHKSGWTPNEMSAKGYSVRGVNGWKFLRTEEARLKWKPELLWQRVSYLTQKITRKIPALAYQIFCVKEVNE